jgi:broad specificity phosphatase PhoE
VTDAHATDGHGEVVLVRHGETEWSRTGRHTGRTDIPLTAEGRREAEAVGPALAGRRFALVVSSPSSRAVETCRLAGFGTGAERWPELAEWDYGAYEGQTMAEIQANRPGWVLWGDGAPGGETAALVGARADRVLARLRAVAGDALVFAHGHVLRVLAARWLELPPEQGRLFVLDPGTVSTLGYEHDSPAIRLWNERPPATRRASARD